MHLYMAFRNRTKRNLRKNRKSRKRGGGIIGEKTLEDNRRNCRAFHFYDRRLRDSLCEDDKHLLTRMYPGWRKRMMGETTGSDIGTNLSF